MDVTFINPVLAAFLDIVPQLGFQTVEKKKVSLEGDTLVNSGLLVNISVVGQLRGVILIGMDIESAKRFASKMMMGMPVVELDAIAQSAMGEVGNMVCATACTKLSEAGVSGLDISPPTLLIGEGGQVKLASPTVVVVEFEADGIPVKVFVGLMADR